MSKKIHNRVKKHRRLSKQRIRSGKMVTSHQSKSGRTGMIHSKSAPSSKQLGVHVEIKTSVPTSVSIHNTVINHIFR
jgi:hypothetical protein